MVPAEAAEIRKAATAVLAGTSLKAVARDWREREIPSVTGAKWAPETVREVLAKPAVAGLAVTARRAGARQVARDPGPGDLGRADRNAG